MNEQEIREYLKKTKYELVKVTRFHGHDSIKVQDKFCTLTWTMRGHIEDYPISELKSMVRE